MCVPSVDDSPLIVFLLFLLFLLLFTTFVIRTKNLVSSKVEFLRLLNRKRVYYDEQEYSIVIRMCASMCSCRACVRRVCVCMRACCWCSSMYTSSEKRASSTFKRTDQFRAHPFSLSLSLSLTLSVRCQVAAAR